MIHLGLWFLYCLCLSWFLTVFLVVCPFLKTSSLLVLPFHHLLQPAVHLRLIHLIMPQVTDALRNDHTAEWTKDNITSRNSGEKYYSSLNTTFFWWMLHRKLHKREKSKTVTKKRFFYPNKAMLISPLKSPNNRKFRLLHLLSAEFILKSNRIKLSLFRKNLPQLLF